MLLKFIRLVRRLRLVKALLAYKMVFKILGYLSFAAFLWRFGAFSLLSSLSTSFAVYLAAGGWKYWRIVIKTFPRDYRAGKFLLGSIRLMKQYQQTNQNVVSLFEKNVRKHPNKLAFVHVDGKEWTFREVDEYSNAIANYLQSQGYKKGDVVALFMENRPEYVFFWLAMAKIGVLGALINFNLRSESLAHCISVSEAKGLIYGAEMTEAIKEISPMLPSSIVYYSFGDQKATDFPSTHLDPLIQQSSTMTPQRPPVTRFNDKLFYIYTSGTTGLPKAAIIIHSRFFYMAYSVHSLFNMCSDDVIYTTLPLYHTAGGILGVGQALLQGCTVVIRKKFSASRFWEDCIRYNCSVTQYIGEICRYLLAQPNKPTDRQHRVWCAFGNGLRPQIWTQFTQRFGIKWIGEFYGATEGNANIINPDNTVGAVGFCTQILPAAYPITIVRVNEDTGELMRDENGVCVRCEPGQPGELVGKIIKGDPLREFDGYVNKDATSKKIARNVFSKGDSAFLTGDVLVMDEMGYLYFRDRTGDTFRWKGENVSTAEVEATISNIVKLKDSTVYGVEIPGMEGRAGMAAIVDENQALDLKKLYQDLLKALPPYSRPMFIRVLDELELTGTFKLRKLDYRKEGFDPDKTKGDKVYYLDSKAGGYSLLDKQNYQEIITGKIRF